MPASRFIDLIALGILPGIAAAGITAPAFAVAAWLVFKLMPETVKNRMTLFNNLLALN